MRDERSNRPEVRHNERGNDHRERRRRRRDCRDPAGGRIAEARHSVGCEEGHDEIEPDNVTRPRSELTEHGQRVHRVAHRRRPSERHQQRDGPDDHERGRAPVAPRRAHSGRREREHDHARVAAHLGQVPLTAVMARVGALGALVAEKERKCEKRGVRTGEREADCRLVVDVRAIRIGDDGGRGHELHRGERGADRDQKESDPQRADAGERNGVDRDDEDDEREHLAVSRKQCQRERA